MLGYARSTIQREVKVVTTMLTLTVDRHVSVPMRDGVILSADVYRPAGVGPFPTVLVRTPYDKGSHGPSPLLIRVASAGYAVMVQDTRGRYMSGGEFIPFVYERDDGFDTIEWLVAQPWCNGKIGMYGGSYVGVTQWQAALSRHPALKAIVPNVTASNLHHGWVYQGGAFELGFNLSWTAAGLSHDTALKAHGGDMSAPDMQELLDITDTQTAAFETLPLRGREILQRHARYYDQWLDHPSYDDLWETLDVRPAYHDLSVAALNLGGWYDIFLAGTLENFSGLRAASADPSRHQLMVGPWHHEGLRSGNPIGRMTFGIRSTGGYVDEGGMHLRWYDRWLRDEDNGVEGEPPARLFVMGAGRWRTADSWPLPGTDFQDWFFHSGGRANSASGDGVLSRDAPSEEPPDSFVYNPRNPVPSVGGPLCCNNVFTLGGAFDQRAVEQREDVLVYTTPPLEHDIEVTGPLKVVLFAASTAPDTDFTAKLVDVHPCGLAQNLNDGIIRARYRQSMREPMPITPNEVVEYEIDLIGTSNMFRAGHRIRVEISSSNFPRFDRNPNTGESIATATELVNAMQTIHHSPWAPSRIVLPVVEA